MKSKYRGIFSAVMQYGGTGLAVGGFSFFGGNDCGGRWCYQNMAVNRHITGTAHQGGNFTAGKIPTTTLKSINIHAPVFASIIVTTVVIVIDFLGFSVR